MGQGSSTMSVGSNPTKIPLQSCEMKECYYDSGVKAYRISYLSFQYEKEVARCLADPQLNAIKALGCQFRQPQSFLGPQSSLEIYCGGPDATEAQITATARKVFEAIQKIFTIKEWGSVKQQYLRKVDLEEEPDLTGLVRPKAQKLTLHYGWPASRCVAEIEFNDWQEIRALEKNDEVLEILKAYRLVLHIVRDFSGNKTVKISVEYLVDSKVNDNAVDKAGKALSKIFDALEMAKVVHDFAKEQKEEEEIRVRAKEQDRQSDRFHSLHHRGPYGIWGHPGAGGNGGGGH